MSHTVVLLDNPVLEYRANSSVPVNIKAVASRIANYFDNIDASATRTTQTYFVPFAAVHADLAKEKGIEGVGNLYGGIVRHHAHADKAILHVTPTQRSDAEIPSWYSREFSYSVQDAVLPGYTAFTAEDVMTGYDLMRHDGFAVRLKDPANTGGLGQHLVNGYSDLHEALVPYRHKLHKTGIVLEADLYRPVTVTIGYVNLEGEVYTWYGRPYDVEHEGMMRFGGNELTVVRGDLSVLRGYADNSESLLAIGQAKRVFDAYGLLDTSISRATLDVVQGMSLGGSFMSGVTDPSLRPSASSAAEIRAIEALAANPDATVAKTRLVYDYWKRDESTRGQELFVSHARMNILVELVRVA